jgi:hypothetical protein
MIYYLEKDCFMYCVKCNNHIGECTCGDIKERLASLNNSPHFVYKKCRICGKHYSLCQCSEPDWTSSHDGKELSDFGAHG